MSTESGSQIIGNPVLDHLDLWSSVTVKKAATGRGSNRSIAPYGIQKLRELILELAVRGKLVPQDANDESADVLLEKIANEKARLIKEGRVRKQKPLPQIADEETVFELPQGWEWVRLGDVIEFVNGYAFKSSDFMDEGIGIVKIGDIQGGKISTASMSRVQSEVVSGLDENLRILSGDMVIAMSGATTGKLGFNESNEVLYLNQRVGKINPYAIEKDFLYLPLTVKIAENLAKSMGSAIPNLSTTQIKEIIVAIPPLQEQHRIVAKVDELMALCDQLEQQQTDSLQAHQTLVETLLHTLVESGDDVQEAQVSWEAGMPGATAESTQQAWNRIAENFDTLFTTEESIDQLKQTILQLAVMGRLVPQDPNDEPASVLLEKVGEKKRALIENGEIRRPKALPKIEDGDLPFTVPTSWRWVYVWDVAKTITSGSRDWAKFYADDGAIFVTMGNLSRGDYRLRMDEIRYVKPPTNGEGTRTRLQAFDLLISITGDVGNLGLIPEGFGEAYINQHTCMLRFMPDCRNRYFPELMRSPWAKWQFDAPQRGVKNSFRLSDVGEMLIPVPPLDEQQRIVTKVDELMALCDTLKARIQQAQTTQVNLADAIVEQAVA